MSEDTDLVEEFLERVKERFSVEDLVEILDMDIDEFIALTWDDLLENEYLQEELGYKHE